MTEEGCRETPGCWDGVLYNGKMIGTVSANFGLTPDPSPTAGGVWAGVGQAECYKTPPNSARGPDIDLDGLVDDCEYRLAYLFAPSLMISTGDACPLGEPYWAARFFDNYDPVSGLGGWGRFVRIAYLLSYYKDCGAGAHRGDSEMITVQVTYNPNTQHWHFMKAFLTAHYLSANSNSLWYTPSSLQFPTGDTLDYPRVFVSKNKHANYRSSSCGAPGNLTFDECPAPYDTGRVKVFASHNIGGDIHQFIDCRESINPLYWTNGREECFHTNTTFRGWQTAGTGSATAYVQIMTTYAYKCFAYDILNIDRCYWGVAGPND